MADGDAEPRRVGGKLLQTGTTGDPGALALRLLRGAAEPALLVDVAGRISGWNRGAERLLGYRRHDVLGRPCHAVLRCRDWRGRPLCAPSCPLFQAMRQAKPAAMDVRANHRCGRAIELSANVVHPLAQLGAHALVLLRPSADVAVEEYPDIRAWPKDGSRPAQAHAPGPRVDLTSALDRVLLATGADAAELFLAAPWDGRTVLAAHRGQAPRAFRQILCFEPGQGFPGLVAQTGEQLLSLDLPHDDRYLRTMVKQQGFRYYLCVPIWSTAGCVGSLHIASRHHADTVAPHLPFLAHVAQHLGATLERQRLNAALAVAGQAFDPAADAGTNLRQTADHALHTLIEVASADCGALLLCDSATGALTLAGEFGLPPRLRRTLLRACKLEACPAVAGRRCVLLAPAVRTDWSLCEAVRRDVAIAVCAPLLVAGEPLGVVLLGCRHREPLPTRHLSFIHAAVDNAAIIIHNARVALRAELGARARGGAGGGPPVDVPARRPLATAVAGTDGSARPGASIPFLDLRCFGQFTAFSDGGLVAPERFARRRSLTLLKILLTRYGKQVHREELMELLWPDADPRTAATLLHVAVHYLRRGLEPNAPAGRPSSFIRTVGECYAFDTASAHRLDSQEFLAAVRLGGHAESRGQRAEASDAYARAMALYVNDFLEDEPYSDWCALEREYLRESLLTTVRRAASLHMAQGRLDAAAACYRRALVVDATLEDVHRALMETLWRAGRRDEALRQYRECRVALERELGIAPMPETEDLRQRIIAGTC